MDPGTLGDIGNMSLGDSGSQCCHGHFENARESLSLPSLSENQRLNLPNGIIGKASSLDFQGLDAGHG